MTNAYNQLKKELSILYPDVTDIELNEMTNNLIDFFTTVVKSVLEDNNQDQKELVVDDKNFDKAPTSRPWGQQVNILK